MVQTRRSSVRTAKRGQAAAADAPVLAAHAAAASAADQTVEEFLKAQLEQHLSKVRLQAEEYIAKFKAEAALVRRELSELH